MEELLLKPDVSKFIYETARVYRAEFTVDWNNYKDVRIDVYGIYEVLTPKEKQEIRKQLRAYYCLMASRVGRKIKIFI